ncbi:MAG: hypothetical protein FWJ90_15870 [Actinomadura sp.]
MTGLIVVFVGIAIVLFLLGCMDQRKLYWKTAAWQYRNPEANEPSDAALGLNRVGLFAAAVGMLVCAGIVHSADAASTYSTSEVSSVAYSVASELNRGDQSGLASSYSTSSEVYEAVNEKGNGNVEIRSVGGDRYELTNRDGENPVCLTVKVDHDLNLGSTAGGPWSHSISTSVDEGPC